MARRVLRMLAVLLPAGLAAVGFARAEPVSLAEWREGPPRFVAEDLAFVLRSVKTSISHRPERGVPRADGATLRIGGVLHGPDPRQRPSQRATILLDEVTDGRGTDLLRLAEPAPPHDDALPFRMAARPVSKTLTGLPWVPASLGVLRGRVRTTVVDAVEVIDLDLAISETLKEVHPGVSARIRKVEVDDRQVAVDFDLAIRNAPDGFDAARPPYVSGIELTDGAGKKFDTFQVDTPRSERPVVLHTGQHTPYRVTARGQRGLSTVGVRVTLVTQAHQIEIPFHLTDVPLCHDPSGAAAIDDDAPTRGDRLPALTVEADDIRLEMTSLRSEAGLEIEDPQGPRVDASIKGRLRLLLPGRDETWMIPLAPSITTLTDAAGDAIPFEPPEPRWAAKLPTTPWAHYEATYTIPHRATPPRGLGTFAGEVHLSRVRRVETLERPWAALGETEVAPGIRVELYEPSRKGRVDQLAVRLVRSGAAAAWPHDAITEPVVIDEKGEEHRLSWKMVEQTREDQTTVDRGTLSFSRNANRPAPASLRLLVLVEVEALVIPFSFTDVPLSVRGPAGPPP